MKKISNRSKRLIRFGIVLVVIILLIKYSTQIGRLIAIISDALFPLVLGLIIAFALNILMRGIEKVYFPNSTKPAVIKSRRPVCLTASLLLLTAIVVAAVALVIPEIAKAVTILGDEIPVAAGNIKDWLTENFGETGLADMFTTTKASWKELFPKITSFITSGATGLLDSAFSIATSTLSTLANILIAVIFAVYLLYNKETLIEQFKKVLRAYNPYKGQRFGHYLSIANKTFSSFVIGQCCDALLLGIIIGVGMFVFGFPYALLTGVIVGISAWIPIVGAWMGAIIGAFLILTVSPMKAIIFIAFYLVVQVLEENLIYTRVVGSSVGLPSIWVLAAVTVGGGLFGIFGMVFSVPLVATFYKILRERVNERLENKSTAEVIDEKPKEPQDE